MLDLKIRLEMITPEGAAFGGELSIEQVEEAVGGLVGSLGYRTTTPAKISGRIYRAAGADVIVDGRFKATVLFDCARCLSERTIEVDHRVDHVLVQRKRIKSVQPDVVSLEGDVDLDPDTHAYEGDTLELAPIFREDLVLVLPMNPKCGDAGVICEREPLTEIEEDEPDAEVQVIDPCWAPLLELKKKLN